MSKVPVLPIETQKLTAALYSVSQQCFHLEPLKDYISLNIKNAARNHFNDYQLIGIFKDDLEGNKYIEKFRETLEKIKASYHE